MPTLSDKIIILNSEDLGNRNVLLSEAEASLSGKYITYGGGPKQGDVLNFSKWIHVLKMQLAHRKQSVSAWGR